MPWSVKIEIRRTGLVIPPELPQRIETGGNSPRYALARAVLAALPVVGASMPGLFRAMTDLRRTALEADRSSAAPPGKTVSAVAASGPEAAE